MSVHEETVNNKGVICSSTVLLSRFTYAFLHYECRAWLDRRHVVKNLSVDFSDAFSRYGFVHMQEYGIGDMYIYLYIFKTM